MPSDLIPLSKDKDTASSFVLIVEDEPSAAEAISLLLEFEGYQSKIAGTVGEAMESLKNSPNPSWIILDLMLPDGDGSSVLQLIRARELPIKVVVASGTGDEGKIKSVMNLKPDMFLPKPIDFDKLIKLLGT